MSLFRRTTIPTVTVADLAKTMAEKPGTVVVDVREPHEYAGGHVPGALSMPLGTVRARHEELPRDRTVHLICQTGVRSGQAARWLVKQATKSPTSRVAPAFGSAAGTPSAPEAAPADRRLRPTESVRGRPCSP